MVEAVGVLQGDYQRLRAATGDDSAKVETAVGLYRSIRQRANPRLVAAWRARHGTNLEELLGREQQQLADRLLGALHAHMLAMDRKGGLEEAMAGVFANLCLFHQIGALEQAISGACEAIRAFATTTLSNIIATQGTPREGRMGSSPLMSSLALL